jgi:hypothetical protein
MFGRVWHRARVGFLPLRAMTAALLAAALLAAALPVLPAGGARG